jgi:arylsulfatase A-like enzyme
MDRNVGRVVAHLKKTGEWNNTLIFFQRYEKTT